MCVCVFARMFAGVCVHVCVRVCVSVRTFPAASGRCAGTACVG